MCKMKLRISDDGLKRIATKVGQDEYWTEQSVAASTREDAFEIVYNKLREGEPWEAVLDHIIGYLRDGVGLQEPQAKVLAEEIMNEADEAVEMNVGMR